MNIILKFYIQNYEYNFPTLDKYNFDSHFKQTFAKTRLCVINLTHI